MISVVSGDHLTKWATATGNDRTQFRAKNNLGNVFGSIEINFEKKLVEREIPAACCLKEIWCPPLVGLFLHCFLSFYSCLLVFLSLFTADPFSLSFFFVLNPSLEPYRIPLLLLKYQFLCESFILSVCTGGCFYSTFCCWLPSISLLSNCFSLPLFHIFSF